MIARPLLIGLLALATWATIAASIPIELKPGDIVDGKILAGGFIFEITSERAATGDAASFRVLITEDASRFSDQSPTVVLSRVVESSTPDGGWSQQIAPFQTLSADRSPHSASCNFTVGSDLVKDPAVAFEFTNPAPPQLVDGRLLRMPSSTIFFARLRGFAK